MPSPRVMTWGVIVAPGDSWLALSRAAGDLDDTINIRRGERFPRSVRPADLDSIDPIDITQSEVRPRVAAGQVAESSGYRPHLPLAVTQDGYAGPDRVAPQP